MSETLVTKDELRELFDIVSEIKDARLNFCVSAASRQLKAWVGAAVYTDALKGTEATDKDRAAQLKASESYLAAYHTLLNAGLRLRPSGVVKQEQDASGNMGGRGVINQYLSPQELSQLCDQYLEQATEMAAPYRQQASSPRAGTLTLKGAYRRPSWLTTEQGLVDHSISSLIGDDAPDCALEDHDWLEP